VNEFRGYDQLHEEFTRIYSRSLPEDHRRRYAAVEALKIGFGGLPMWRGLGDEPIYIMGSDTVFVLCFVQSLHFTT
jgi:hypothetical protein